MQRTPSPTRRLAGGPGLKRSVAAVVAVAAGAGAAVLTGIAGARSFTLGAASGHVGATAEAIAVDGRGFAVYYLTGESARHFLCTTGNGCLKFWPPVTVAAGAKLTKAPGIRGTLSTTVRTISGRRVHQLTLAGRPLYQFAGDRSKARANGNGIKGFGGTWHVVLGNGSGAPVGGGGMTGTGTGTTTTTTTTTPTYTYTTPTYTYPGY